jgi:pyridoxal phosphate enzyme (YggS family)
MTEDDQIAVRVAEVRSRLVATRREIVRIERQWTHDVEILPVTKGFTPWAIEAAVAADCTSIGENYAQELISKSETVSRLHPDVYFIGQLQSNKVRQLVGLVDVWATLDRTSIVKEVAKRAAGARVLIQVNTTGESGKGGCSLPDLPDLVELVHRSGLELEGLMTVGPTGTPAEHARSGFRTVRKKVDEFGLSVCSMGMTADMQVAIEEGSTQIRVGTALFGPRPLKR